MRKDVFTREYIIEMVEYFEDNCHWLNGVRSTYEDSQNFFEDLKRYCNPISDEYDADIISISEYFEYRDRICSARHNMIKYHIGWLLNLWKDGRGEEVVHEIGVENFVLTIYNDFFHNDYDTGECLPYYEHINELSRAKKL